MLPTRASSRLRPWATDLNFRRPSSLFPRPGHALHGRRSVEILERGDDRQTADELGDQAELQQILRLDLAQPLAGATLIRTHDASTEADGRALATASDDLLQPGESAATDEE